MTQHERELLACAGRLISGVRMPDVITRITVEVSRNHAWRSSDVGSRQSDLIFSAFDADGVFYVDAFPCVLFGSEVGSLSELKAFFEEFASAAALLKGAPPGPLGE